MLKNEKNYSTFCKFCGAGAASFGCRCRKVMQLRLWRLRLQTWYSIVYQLNQKKSRLKIFLLYVYFGLLSKSWMGTTVYGRVGAGAVSEFFTYSQSRIKVMRLRNTAYCVLIGVVRVADLGCLSRIQPFLVIPDPGSYINKRGAK
jgi:hypothetical protein